VLVFFIIGIYFLNFIYFSKGKGNWGKWGKWRLGLGNIFICGREIIGKFYQILNRFGLI
jgi:uncharacterized membrane protein